MNAPARIHAVQSAPHQEEVTKRWLLARLRTIRAGMMLVVAQVDEIGLDLKDGRITSEMAMWDVTALEQMPVHVAAHVCSPTEGCEGCE